MNSHLDEKQLTEALLGFAEPSEQAHLQVCDQCRAQLASEKGLFSRFGQVARAEAERTEDFWVRQRLVISRRMEQSAQRRTLRVVWSAAATAAAGLVLWVVLGQSPSNPVPPPSSHDDDVLLRQVASALERGTPEAFAPAEVLTHELNRSTSKRASSSSEARRKSEARAK